MSRNLNLANDEIDLRELFATLWSHKLIIVLFTGFSILLAGYNALSLEKKFTAKAIFQIEQKKDSSGFNFSSELGTLASIAGLSSVQAASSIDLLLERTKGREFIIDMKTKFSLDRNFILTHMIQITQTPPGRGH